MQDNTNQTPVAVDPNTPVTDVTQTPVSTDTPTVTPAPTADMTNVTETPAPVASEPTVTEMPAMTEEPKVEAVPEVPVAAPTV